MDEVAKITLWIPDQRALATVLATAAVQLDCGAPRPEADGTFKITVYGTKADAKKLAALGYKHDIDEQYGEVLKQRQAEVSTTDRFKGGAVKPTGLGVKK